MSDADFLKSGYDLLKTANLFKKWKQSNPNEAQALDDFINNTLAGKNPTPPVLASPYGKSVVQWVQMCQTEIPTPPPPPPPPPPTTSTKMWGFCLSPPGGNWANLTEAAGRRQLEEAKALGMTCPRITGHTWAAQACRDLGFPHWIVILGAGKNFADDAGTIRYCKAWPEAIIEPGNELNIGGSPWTAEALAARQLAWVQAVRASGVKNMLSIASIGNDSSTQGNLLPLDFCKRMAAAGHVYPAMGDVGSYHAYHYDAQAYDNWMHVWTPLNGISCQSAFHDPPYMITEFNLHTADANAKAAAIKSYMDHIKADPNCIGGHVYTILNTTDAGTNWGLDTDSYAKIQPPWDTFHAGATGAALSVEMQRRLAIAAPPADFKPDHETGRKRPVYPEI